MSEVATAPVGRAEPSAWRAWVTLTLFSMRRLGRARIMVFVAVALLAIAVAIVVVNTMENRWSFGTRHYTYPSARSGFLFHPPPPPKGKSKASTATRVTYTEAGEHLAAIAGAAAPGSPYQVAISAASGAYQATMASSGVVVYTRGIMFSVFLGFLLPVWCLSFATESLGSERESRAIVWLLTRPLPRWAIYLAKYLAILPWALGFCIGGFWLMGRAAGLPGEMAFSLYWPAIALGTLAFTSVFHLITAWTRRPTVVGLVYCFFLETLLGDMPGLMKRACLSYHVRCVIFDAAADLGLQPDRPAVYQPISGPAAMAVLISVTLVALALGMVRFSRAEYCDDAS